MAGNKKHFLGMNSSTIPIPIPILFHAVCVHRQRQRDRDTAEPRCPPGAEGKAPGYESPAEPRRCGQSPPSVPCSRSPRTPVLEPEALPRAPASPGGGRGLEGTTERLINAGEPGLGDSGLEPICGAGAQARAAGNSEKVSPRVSPQRVLGSGHPCGVPSRVDGHLNPPAPGVSPAHTGG